MKKIDSILQKAALFEKLAVYGDRSSFLRAIAQASPLNNQMKEHLSSLVLDISAMPGGESLANLLSDFQNGTNTNINELLPLVQKAARLIPKSTNGTQRARADQLIKMLGGTPQLEELPPDPNNAYQASFETQRHSGIPEAYQDTAPSSVKQKPLWTPIDPEIQKQLSKIVTSNGWGLSILTDDGKLGRETRKAIDAFKNNAPGMKGKSDQEVFDEVKRMSAGAGYMQRGQFVPSKPGEEPV